MPISFFPEPVLRKYVPGSVLEYISPKRTASAVGRTCGGNILEILRRRRMSSERTKYRGDRELVVLAEVFDRHSDGSFSGRVRSYSDHQPCRVGWRHVI